MIAGFALLFVSMVVVLLASVNAYNCVRRGKASAYGRSYLKSEAPIAFWISFWCSLAAILIGLLLAAVALFGLLNGFA